MDQEMIAQCLNDIKQQLTEIRGDLNTRVAQSQGRHSEIDTRIKALEQTCAERNRAVHHQLAALKTMGMAIITTVVIAASTVIAAILMN